MPQTLTHSPAHVIAKLLRDLGLGTVPPTPPALASAWPVYVGSEPDSPDSVITTYNTQGRDQGRSMLDGELYTDGGVQVRVRSKDHPTGWTKADAIQNTLAKNVYLTEVHLEHGGVHGDYLVHSVCDIGNVLDIGKDPNSSRNLMTINCIPIIEEI